MQMSYTNFDDGDLRGDTLADYLIAIDADFEIRDGDRIIYDEPEFPVVELARSLSSWMASNEYDDFAFDSLSSDESGLVTITRGATGWRLSSVFTPELVSSEMNLSELEACIQGFVDHVATDLTGRGHDADRILRG
jgi:hypothetical protein